MKKELLNLKNAFMTLGVVFATTANAQFTAVTSGNWSNSATWGGTAPTLTVSGQDITIPSGITVNLDQDVTFSGILNSFSVDGVLTSTTTNGVLISQGSLSGNGNIGINWVKFSGIASAAFSGNLAVKRLMNNSSLSLGFTAIANVADTLELIAGSLSLNTNANLNMATNSVVKVGNGSIAINGGIFGSGNAYNVMYVGTSKSTGVELNTLNLKDMYVMLDDNSQSLSLNSNIAVNGDVHFQSGMLALNGKQLTLKKDLMMMAGTSFSSTSTSDLMIEGSGSLTSSLVFASGSSIDMLSINRTSSATVKLGSSLNVSGQVKLIEGNFSLESGSNLTMNVNSLVHIEKGMLTANTGSFTGTAAYNVEYMGGTNASTGIELTGSGLNNLSVSYGTASNKVVLNNNIAVNGALYMTQGMLDFNGKNVTLNGTIAQSAKANFIGNQSSELILNLTSVTGDSLFFDASSSNNYTLSKLKVNTTGSSSIVLGTMLMIKNELNFTNGKLVLANGDLKLMSTAMITGFDDTKYIVTSQNASGNLVMNVNSGSTFVTFPIGTSEFSPAYVQQNSAGTTGDFSVKAMNTILSNGYTGFNTSSNTNVVNRTWFVSSTATSINTNLKFGWTAAAEINGFDRTNAYITHYTNTAWDVTAASSATVGSYNTFEIQRNGLTSLSPFAVTEPNQALKVNENDKLAGIQVYPNPSTDLVFVKNNVAGVYTYELTDLTGRTIVLELNNNNSINKFDVSSLSKGCYFIKITDVSSNKTSVKRFIKD